MPSVLFLVVVIVCCLPCKDLKAETHHVIPDRYYDTFSAGHPPVAKIRDGDTVVTKLLDSRGHDDKGKLVLYANNVLTGPFYVEGAKLGDTLVVRLDRVRLNRDWGWNGVRVYLDALAPRSLEGIFSPICCDEWLQPGRRNALRWDLDLKRNVVKPSRPIGDRVTMEFPARPAVGAIAVAPPTKQAISTSSPAGFYGGTIDYNGTEEGVIVYLPVYEPGALLFVGDGHAAHGDGELLGQGTETSLDLQFTVRLIKGRSISSPRLEHPDSLVTFGCTGALEEGFRYAMSEMINWLTKDYGLNPQEAHVLLGLTAELRIAAWGARTSLCKVPKKYLPEPVAAR